MTLRRFTTLILIAALWRGAFAAAEPPAMYVDRIDAIPDLTQTLIDDAALGHGEELCAPVAVSNSLAYLAQNGYPKLAEASDAAQIELVRTLAAPEYMQTSAGSGTSKSGLLDGIEQYVTSRGYRVDTLEYRGLEIHFKPDEYPPSTVVGLTWLKSRLARGASVWPQVGWYRKTGSDYQKSGTHWVTLAGYGADESGDPDPRILILHDPSPRAGMTHANEYVRTERFETGRIIGWGLPQHAAGLHRLGEGMHLPDDAGTAILEGAVVLKLAAP